MKPITAWLWLVTLLFCGLWSVLLWVCWPFAASFSPNLPERPLLPRCQKQRNLHLRPEAPQAGTPHPTVLARAR
jgi:hypothetical protein